MATSRSTPTRRRRSSTTAQLRNRLISRSAEGAAPTGRPLADSGLGFWADGYRFDGSTGRTLVETRANSSADLSGGEAAADEAELLGRAGRGSSDHAPVLFRMAPHQRRDGTDMPEPRLEPLVLIGVANHERPLRAEPGQAVAT